MKCDRCQSRCRTNRWWIKVQTSIGVAKSIHFCTKKCLSLRITSGVILIDCNHPKTTACRPGTPGCLHSDDIS